MDARCLSASQVRCEEKSHEIEAIPRLLAALELGGSTVTIDAMDTQVAIAAQIHEAGADYVLSLKANQKGALEEVSTAFADPHATPPQPSQPELPPPAAECSAL